MQSARARHLHGVRPHPEEMAGVQIHPQNVVSHLTPQAAERLHIVHQLPAMELQGDALHPVVPGPGGQRLPHRDGRLPLVVEDFLRLRRPGRDDPGGSTVLRAAAGQAAHHHHGLHPQLLRQEERALRHRPVSGSLLPGEQGVAGAVQGGDREAVFPQSIQQPVPGTGVRRQPFRSTWGAGDQLPRSPAPPAPAPVPGRRPLLCQERSARLSVTKLSFASILLRLHLDTLMIPEPLPRRNPELMLDGGGFGLYGNKGKISSVF